MSKLIIRWTVIITAAYLVLCYVVAFVFRIDIWCQAYYLLFELCVCLCISKQGVYHCRFIKWTAYAILIEDTLTCTDVLFDYLPVNFAALLQPTIITAGVATTATLAVKHYIRTKKIKRQWRQSHQY